MQLDLVDLLRCVEDHEESWLVATVDERDGRDVVRGSLGCPVCGRVYPVVDGAVNFRDDAPVASAPRGDVTADRPSSTVRLAALLDLRDDGGVVVLAGAHAREAAALGAMAAVRCLVVNPEAPVAGDGMLVVGERIPLAAGNVRGVAVDAATASERRLEGFVRALRPGGRLVAPAGTPLPSGVRELARDAREWVAERVAPASPPVALRRRPGIAPPGADR